MYINCLCDIYCNYEYVGNMKMMHFTEVNNQTSLYLLTITHHISALSYSSTKFRSLSYHNMNICTVPLPSPFSNDTHSEPYIMHMTISC